MGSLHGFMYKYLKNMVLNLFGPESLKKMVPEVEGAARKRLQLWASQDSIELKEATASVITNYCFYLALALINIMSVFMPNYTIFPIYR